MVKIDAKKDYYAELDVSSTADVEEIKKQFRKLALKYHPDRNPGREAECVPRFQAIQAAHEILTDPSQRSKYDAERRRQPDYYSSFARTTASPRTNLYTANSPFPPPPRRTQAPPPRTRPEYTSTASNGASRFSNFPPPPTSARTSMRDDPSAKANVFTAWQNMNRKKQQTTQEEPPPRPHTTWGTGPNMGRSSTTRATRKTGFDPMAPGADEPPAPGTSYYTSTRWSDRPVPSPPRTRPATPSAHKAPEDDVPFTEGRPRARAPYASNGSGERIFTTSPSMRHSPRRPESGEPVQPPSSAKVKSPRHRSASPGTRKPFSGTGSPTPRPQSKASADSPTTAQSRKGGNATRPFFSHNNYDSSDEDEILGTPRHPSATFGQNPTHRENGASNGNQPSSPQGKAPTKSNIFSFPIDENTFKPMRAPEFKSKSEESINTRFVASDWNGKFEGSPNYKSTHTSKTSRTKASPVRSEFASPRNPNAFSTDDIPPPAPAPPPPPPTAHPAANGLPGQGRFSPEQWKQHFKEPTWVFPTRPGSPTRPKLPPKSRRPTVPRPATVSDDSEDAETPNGTFGANQPVSPSPNGAADAYDNAMDIDEEVLPPKAAPPPMREPRVVPVSPMRPTFKNSAQTHAEGTKMTDDDPATFKLGNLKNVAPFTSTTQEGLGNLEDLTSTLPFPSKPSNQYPTKPSTPETPRPLQCPKGPPPPTQERLDAQTWKEYLQKFMAYWTEWNKFNKAMLGQMQTHQFEADRLTAHHFAALGDTSEGGLDRYMDSLRQNAKARAQWEMACKMHNVAMSKFSDVRARVLKYGLTN